jgi:HSP20 family molecular chaperone IbpA
MNYLYNRDKTQIKDSGDDYIAEFELAGFSKKDLAVTATNSNLIIDAKNEDRQSHFKLNLYGIVSIENIVSNMKNGLLTVTLPKKSVIGRRTVEIK